LFDRSERTIGLKPAVWGRDRNAYRVRKECKGTNRNRTIFARPLRREFGIEVERTIVFDKCRIDRDEVLVLNLDDTRELPAKAETRSCGIVSAQDEGDTLPTGRVSACYTEQF
jgi:hypothetical protein